MTTVSTALLTPDAVAANVERLRPRAPFAILERAEKIDFPGEREVVRWADWPKGRIFGSDVELRWEEEDGARRATLIELRADIPSGFEVVLSLDEATAQKPERYFLWGEDDLAIGGRLDYSRVIPQKGRGELWVVRYTDGAGRLLFYRYVSLQREEPSAAKAAR